MTAEFEYDGERVKVTLWRRGYPRFALGTLKTRDYPAWRGEGGETLLHKAAGCVHAVFLGHFLSNGCDVLVNVRDDTGVLPLCNVSRPGHLRLLLEAGADPNLPTGLSGRPVGLMTIAYRNGAEMLEMLLSAGFRLDEHLHTMSMLPDPRGWSWSLAAILDQKDPDIRFLGFWWLEERKWPWRTEDEVHETRWRVYFRHPLVWQLLIGLAQIQRAPVKR